MRTAIVFLCALWSGLVSAQETRVIDGDTIELRGVIGFPDGTRFRLRGIDAPERQQRCTKEGANYPCGERASDALRALIERQDLSCAGTGHDKYGRTVGVCLTDRGGDIAEAMVRAGWAVVDPWSGGWYVREELSARRRNAGVWAGDFKLPHVWRAERRAAAKPAALPPQSAPPAQQER